jgi:hypothetical protein
LHRECFGLLPDETFADLFDDVGRIEGCRNREAVDRFAVDARWKYAAGRLDFDYPGFEHTVLVDMRAARRVGASGPEL